MVVYHDQVELFFAVALIDRGEEHAAGVDAHHRSGRQVGDGDQGLADELFGLVEGVDAAEDGAVGAGAVIEAELEELLGLLDRFAGLDLYGAEIGLYEGVEIDVIGKERLDPDV